MTEFSSIVGSFEEFSGETAIVFTSFKKGKDKSSPKSLVIHGLPKPAALRIAKYFDDEVYGSKPGECFFWRSFNSDGIKDLLLVGVGESGKHNAEALRRASAAAFKALKGHKAKEAGVSIESATPFMKDNKELACAITEGMGLASYAFDELKSKKSDKKNPVKKIVLLAPTAQIDKGVKKGIEEGVIVFESVNLARRLGDLPGNLHTPSIMAEEAQRVGKSAGVKVTVWNGDRIKKEKMDLFWSVAKGSSEDPRFIIMEYKGAAASKQPVCFVGKGLTFDAGGISLKPSAAMEEMKFDMCGGAAVIATVMAAARLKLKVNILAYVPSAENLPGPTANKPGDIHTGRNGKTVEINNTDAEGRLILADALTYACEQKPAWIADAATLTGAMKMALGDIHTGFFSRDEKLTKKIEEAAEASGEKLWQMPLTEEHHKDIKGNYADLSNISYVQGAGSAKGAAFLSEFVEEDIPWAHFDIAATAWNAGSRAPYNPDKGASGVIVRTFIELAKAAQ